MKCIKKYFLSYSECVTWDVVKRFALHNMIPSDLSTRGCDMRMQMCRPDAIPQSYPDDKGK